jgi:Aminoacyl-tRNA editing domain
MERALELTGMEYGGITPIGLPGDWPIFVDSRVIAEPAVIIGSGVRRSKILLPGRLLERLPAVQVVDGLANEIAAPSPNSGVSVTDVADVNSTRDTRHSGLTNS